MKSKDWRSYPDCAKPESMIKPELTDVGWLGPRDEMDRASHRFGKCSECSECHEITCVEKAVTDTLNTRPETNELLNNVFRAHVKVKHVPNAPRADAA